MQFKIRFVRLFLISFFGLSSVFAALPANAVIRECGGSCFCDASNCCSCPTPEYGYVCIDYFSCSPGGGGGGSVYVPEIQLRADVNRDGRVSAINLSSSDPDELDENKWSPQRGAIILPNIDYDYANNGNVTNLSKIDSSDNIINGSEDLKDLAVVRILPWTVNPDQGDKASATLLYPDDLINVFIKRSNQNGGYVLWDPRNDSLSGTELLNGVELRVEAVDIATDVNSRYVDIAVHATFQVSEDSSRRKADVVRLRIAPLIFHHHLDNPDKVIISPLSATDNDYVPFEEDMKQAAVDADLELHQYTNIFPESGVGQWIQDRLEAAYLSMPKIEGSGQQSMRVFLYNGSRGDESRNFALIESGIDVAALPYFKTSHGNLDMGGNFETIPPTNDYPFGRVLRGTKSATDQDLSVILDAQSLQPELSSDVFTDWLNIGHIDEVISFIPQNNARGWSVLVSDPKLAKKLILDIKASGKGDTSLLTGISYDSILKQVTINQLIESEVWGENEKAITFVEDVITSLKRQLKLAESDFIRLPVLFYGEEPYISAYTANVTNGALLRKDYFASPKPYGPIVDGKDYFEKYVETELYQERGIRVKWIEDFLSYHVLHGEVHCGSNVIRKLPDNPWWTKLASSNTSQLKVTEKARKLKKKKVVKKTRKRSRKTVKNSTKASKRI